MSLDQDSVVSFLECVECEKNTEVNEVNGQRLILHRTPSDEVTVQMIKSSKPSLLLTGGFCRKVVGLGISQSGIPENNLFLFGGLN